MSKHIIYGDPIGKPRQTRSDKWKQRTCVMQYRAWADLARFVVWSKNEKHTLEKPISLKVRAWFQNGRQHRVGPHTVKPDGDNVLKSVLDALFTNDQMVYRMSIEKLWADGSAPRIELEWD